MHLGHTRFYQNLPKSRQFSKKAHRIFFSPIHTVDLLVTTKMNIVVEAVENQTTAITQVTEGIDQISSVVQTNSATAQESAAASQELSAEAASLKRLVDGFTLARD